MVVAELARPPPVRLDIAPRIQPIATMLKKCDPASFGGLIESLRSHSQVAGRDGRRNGPSMIQVEFLPCRPDDPCPLPPCVVLIHREGTFLTFPNHPRPKALRIRVGFSRKGKHGKEKVRAASCGMLDDPRQGILPEDGSGSHVRGESAPITLGRVWNVTRKTGTRKNPQKRRMEDCPPCQPPANPFPHHSRAPGFPCRPPAAPPATGPNCDPLGQGGLLEGSKGKPPIKYAGKRRTPDRPAKDRGTSPFAPRSYARDTTKPAERSAPAPT